MDKARVLRLCVRIKRAADHIEKLDDESPPGESLGVYEDTAEIYDCVQSIESLLDLVPTP